MSERNQPEILDRVLDAALARAADEPVAFDVAAGRETLARALRDRTSPAAVPATASATAPVDASATVLPTTDASATALPTASASAAASAAAPVPTSRRRARWLAAAATVAITAGTLVASTVTGDGTGSSASAAQELIHAADLAAHVTDQPLAPGQYRYVNRRHRSIGQAVSGNEAWTMGSRTEVWIPADFRQEWLERQTREVEPAWVPGHEGSGEPDQGGRDEEFRAPCGRFSYYSPEYPDRCTVGSWNNPTPDFVASLPKDPKAMYERMVADGGTDPAGALITAGSGLLTGRLPADVRATMFRALALLPGLVVTEKRANLDGVEGVALGIKYYDTFSELIISPDDGAFIGIRETIAEDGTLAKGTVRSVYSVTTGVVGSLGATP